MLQLFLDSDCDFTKAEADSYGARLISMPYLVDGEEVYPYESWDEFDSTTFYDNLRKGNIPTTSALNPANYVQIFEPAFQKGGKILYIHFSSAMTVTFDAMHKAIDELKSKYPGVRFEEIDTLSMTLGAYQIAREILNFLKAGHSLDETLAYAEENKQRNACIFFVDDLKFFARSGRVSHISSFMGNLMSIKPLIHINEQGQMVSFAKAHGRGGAIKKLVEYVKELGDDIKNHEFIVGHSDCLHLAEKTIAALREEFGEDLNVRLSLTNPTAGSHSGPDGVGVAFHAIHR